MNNQFQICSATVNDVDEITSLFRETVLSINSRDYNAEQVRVWSAGADSKEKWLNKINEQYFITAVSENKIIGFASLAVDGYLDFLYVHKDFRRTGVAAQLYYELESYAAEMNINKIYSDVSITAKPFFEEKGYILIKEQEVKIGDIGLVNYRMEKSLVNS